MFNELQKTPLIQDYYYIDKTKIIYNLLNWSNKYVFLSRPEKWWKSFIANTIKNIYSGNKEIFKGLRIENKWNWNKQNPILFLSISNISESNNYNDIIKTIYDKLSMFLSNLDVKIEFNQSNWVILFSAIREIYKKYNKKVVVIIDDYDKILNNLIWKSCFFDLKNFFNSFYYSLKDAQLEWYLEYLFITWLNSIEWIDLFWWLNFIDNISFSEKYWEIAWFTEEEILIYLKDYIKWCDLKVLKDWYGWYSFNWKNFLYQPYSILKFLNEKKIWKYYFKGWNSHLIKIVLKENNYKFEDIKNWLNKFFDKETLMLLKTNSIKDINIYTLLYQNWYLTIKSIENMRYKIWFPNKESQSNISSLFYK